MWNIENRNNELVERPVNPDTWTTDSTKDSTNWDRKEMIKDINIPKEKSWANAPHAIASALNWLKSLMWWNVTVETPNKKNFEEELDKLNNELPALKKYIESKASTNVADVNAFLKSKDIDLELKDQWDWLYSASVLDVKVDWETPWTKKKLNINKREIDAVKMKNVTFYNSKHEHPIIEINTKSWEKVFMTKYDSPLAKNSIGIYESVKSISENKNISGKKDVIFPMVDFQEKWDIEELKWWSLSNNKEKANITEAKYFHRFRMNEKWARAQAAAATSATRSMSNEPYKIDWPFLVWIETKNWEIPFAAKIWIDDMKNPGSLGDDKESTEVANEMTKAQAPTVSAEQVWYSNDQSQVPAQPAQHQAPTDQNPNQNPEPVPETSSISANYSENIQKADNWDNSDNNWIINDLIWIKQEKGIQSLKNMNSENIKTLLEEFKENFKFKNMKERNPKWVQVTLWVQVALSILWYSAGTIDGYYWPNTKNAVKEFQKNNNLKIDWIAWSETIRKIIELLDKKPS